MAQLKTSYCKVCGSIILSKTGKAELCLTKSSCRVKWSREQKKIQKQSESMIVDMEAFTAYQAVIKELPVMDKALCAILDKTDKDVFKTVVFEMLSALAAQSNNQ